MNCTKAEAFEKIAGWWTQPEWTLARMAVALEVDLSTIGKYKREMGLPSRKPSHFRGAPNRVQVRNICFASYQDCADHFGYHIEHIRRMVRDGKADLIGVGMGNHGKHQGRGVPTRIGPYVWASRREAADALGIAVGHLFRLLKQKRAEDIMVLVQAYERKQRALG